jgi:hypothetical protein
MCFCGEAADGAVLAWAHTAQDARKLAYPAIADWTGCGFIDVRARLLKEYPAYYETLKLRDGPHVNDDPPVCPSCGLWGSPRMGAGCTYCCTDAGA